MEKAYFLSHMSTCISSMTIWEEENKRGRNSRFQAYENERSHPQTFTENNLMYRTVFSIQTESRQERSQSWKRFADEERFFRLTMSFQNFVPTKLNSERRCDENKEKTYWFLNCFHHGNGSFSKCYHIGYLKCVN